MREIIFDTETTGLKPEDGERIIEIGAIELENRFPTGRTFHVYINPDGQPVGQGAFEVHGISEEFLADKPKFHEIVDEFLGFFEGAHWVAHNASFDMRFVNAELKRLDKPTISNDVVIDTLAMAKRKHPMGPNSLDKLCSRYGIDNSHRTKHGALLDSELLAEVYIELLGGKQASLLLDPSAEKNRDDSQNAGDYSQLANRRQRPELLPSRLTEEELKEHAAFVESLGDGAIWNKVS